VADLIQQTITPKNTRKDNSMTKELSTQEKKLNTLRKILWVCFAGITILVILLGVTGLAAFRVLASSIDTYPYDGSLVRMTMPALVITLLIMIGGVGTVCLVIYQIFKYRLEKDDELFL
jgi:hypothetical protein